MAEAKVPATCGVVPNKAEPHGKSQTTPKLAPRELLLSLFLAKLRMEVCLTTDARISLSLFPFALAISQQHCITNIYCPPSWFAVSLVGEVVWGGELKHHLSNLSVLSFHRVHLLSVPGIFTVEEHSGIITY